MVKAKIDYSKGKIYKLICNTTGLTYYGHTTKEYLSQRLDSHRNDCRRWLNGKKNYVTAFKIIKNNNYDIILVELYPCGSINELKSRERYYIENNECVNKYIPLRTDQEYRNDNKEKQKAQNIIWYQKNKEAICNKGKEKVECICGKTLSKNTMYNHKKSKAHLNYVSGTTLSTSS